MQSNGESGPLRKKFMSIDSVKAPVNGAHHPGSFKPVPFQFTGKLLESLGPLQETRQRQLFLRVSLCVGATVQSQASHGDFFAAVLSIGERRNRVQARDGLVIRGSCLGEDRELQAAGARRFGCHIPDFHEGGAHHAPHGQPLRGRGARMVSSPKSDAPSCTEIDQLVAFHFSLEKSLCWGFPKGLKSKAWLFPSLEGKAFSRLNAHLRGLRHTCLGLLAVQSHHILWLLTLPRGSIIKAAFRRL